MICNGDSTLLLYDDIGTRQTQPSLQKKKFIFHDNIAASHSFRTSTDLRVPTDNFTVRRRVCVYLVAATAMEDERFI